MKNYVIQNRQFNDLNPVNFGYEHCKPGKFFGPHIRDHYILHFVVSGKGKFYCDDTCIDVKQGQFFVIQPRETTIYAADNEDPWYYIWVGFTGDLTEKCDFLNKRVVDYNGNVFTEILEIENLENCKEEFLASKLFQLVVELSSRKHSISDYVKSAKNFVLSNYGNNITLSDIAHGIGIDRSYLSKLFKEQIGMTFQDYLTTTRLKKGAEFLSKGHNVSEVAFMCGYTDSASFSRAYKKHFGVPPKQTKAKSKEK